MKTTNPRDIVLATYREPEPQPKRCGTCKSVDMYYQECRHIPKHISLNHGVCDAWTKRE